jgi:hypothetical protein
LAFLLVIWYKLRQARSQKVDLEYKFFLRVDSVLARMNNIFRKKDVQEILK